MQTSTLALHVDSHPDKCGGKPCVAGTRIRVWDIYVSHDLQGRSAEEIVQSYPQLSLAQIYAALSYYWEHREEIEAQIRAGDEYIEDLKRSLSPGLLEEKLFKSDENEA